MRKKNVDKPGQKKCEIQFSVNKVDVNTKNFFFTLQKNKLCYLQQKCASTDLVCLSPLKDISLIKDLRSFYMGNFMCKVNKLSMKISASIKKRVIVFFSESPDDNLKFGVYSGGVTC